MAHSNFCHDELIGQDEQPYVPGVTLDELDVTRLLLLVLVLLSLAKLLEEEKNASLLSFWGKSKKSESNLRFCTGWSLNDRSEDTGLGKLVIVELLDDNEVALQLLASVELDSAKYCDLNKSPPFGDVVLLLVEMWEFLLNCCCGVCENNGANKSGPLDGNCGLGEVVKCEGREGWEGGGGGTVEACGKGLNEKGSLVGKGELLILGPIFGAQVFEFKGMSGSKTWQSSSGDSSLIRSWLRGVLDTRLLLLDNLSIDVVGDLWWLVDGGGGGSNNDEEEATVWGLSEERLDEKDFSDLLIEV